MQAVRDVTSTIDTQATPHCVPHINDISSPASLPTVNDALIAAIETGKIAAAGLDVFAGEPELDERYRSLKNTFLLPHIGSATLGTRSAMGMRALDNLDAFFAGNTPGDLVTPG